MTRVIPQAEVGLHPSPVSRSHVHGGLARPVFVLRLDKGLTHLVPVHLQVRVRALVVGGASVEVEDVDAGERGGEVAGGGVVGVPVVEEDVVELEVSEPVGLLGLNGLRVESDPWAGEVWKCENGRVNLEGLLR